MGDRERSFKGRSILSEKRRVVVKDKRTGHVIIQLNMAEKVLEMLFTFGEANAAAQRPANLDAISALVSEVITHCGLTVRQSADSVQQAKNNWASLLLHTETWIAANEEVSESAVTELAQKFSSNGSFISEADAAAWLLCFLPKIPAPATVAAAPASADTAALAVAISKTVDPLVKAREKATEAYSKKLAGEGLASHPERPRLSLDEFGSCIDGESVNYKSLKKMAIDYTFGGLDAV